MYSGSGTHRDPPGVDDALDAVVVGEQRHRRQLHLHADLEVGGEGALDDLAEHDQALLGELTAATANGSNGSGDGYGGGGG